MDDYDDRSANHAEEESQDTKEDADSKKWPCLVATDKHSHAILCVPAEQKGGSSLPRLVRELYNFTVRVGGQSVVLQGDQENSVQAVVRGVEQLRSKNQLQTVVRYAEKGQPMSNGRAERAVRTLKEMSRTLRQHVLRVQDSSGS